MRKSNLARTLSELRSQKWYYEHHVALLRVLAYRSADSVASSRSLQVHMLIRKESLCIFRRRKQSQIE
jgi:hypothetical protein